MEVVSLALMMISEAWLPQGKQISTGYTSKALLWSLTATYCIDKNGFSEQLPLSDVAFWRSGEQIPIMSSGWRKKKKKSSVGFCFYKCSRNVRRLVQVTTIVVSLFIVDGLHAPVSGHNRPIKDADIRVLVYINGRKLMELEKKICSNSSNQIIFQIFINFCLKYTDHWNLIYLRSHVLKM